MKHALKAPRARMILDAEEATLLARFLAAAEDGDSPATTLWIGDGHAGFGLYASLTEMPEEGAVELTRNVQIAAPEAAEPADLWALHIPGPDDLHAAPSNAEAIDAAAAHNAAWRPVHAAQVAKGNDWPPIECALARVVPWPLDAEEHADGLKDWKPSDWIAPTDSQSGRDAVEARPRNFSTLLPGMELVPCAIWKDGPGGKPWLYVPHADGNWVSAAQLAPFSVGIIDYWRRDHAAWIDRLSTTAGRTAE